MDVGAAIRQQMLSVLIDAIGKPSVSSTTVPAISPSGAAVPAPAPVGPNGGRPDGTLPGAPSGLPPLQPGAQVFARVLSAAPNGDPLIAIGDRLVTARIAGEALPDSARQPGATLLLKLETNGETPRFALLQAQAPGTTGAGLPRAVLTVADGAADMMRSLPQVTIETADAAAALPVRNRIEPPALPALAQAATAAAATRQTSAAAVFAELAPLLDRRESTLPPMATAVAQALLGSRLETDRPITPEALKEAILRAAVPAEALASRGDLTTPDTRTLLAALRGLLAPAASRAAPEAGPDAEPPHRESGPTAIKPGLPRLEPEADPQTTAAVIAREAEQAVERSRLHHFASLPDARPGEAARQHLSFDLPLALGQQTAIAGFRIERDKGRSKSANHEPIDSWGVRFAIDADGLGPVQAHLRLTGNAVSVSLWAEDTGTRQRFIEALPTLEAALADSALDIGDLTILGGRPADPRPPSGTFLDRTS